MGKRFGGPGSIFQWMDLCNWRMDHTPSFLTQQGNMEIKVIQQDNYNIKNTPVHPSRPNRHDDHHDGRWWSKTWQVKIVAFLYFPLFIIDKTHYQWRELKVAWDKKQLQYFTHTGWPAFGDVSHTNRAHMHKDRSAPRAEKERIENIEKGDVNTDLAC